MQAIETISLNEGWWKELRVRQNGKQKGNVFACYTNSAGAVYYSRTKAEQAGCIDTEPDKRTTRHQKKSPTKKKEKAKAQKPAAKAKRKAAAKTKAKKAKDPESAEETNPDLPLDSDAELESAASQAAASDVDWAGL